MDDFWGTEAWEQWSSEIGRVLPPASFRLWMYRSPIRCFAACSRGRRFPNHQHPVLARHRGRNTSERGEDSREAHLRAIRDHYGRIMVLMTHNTDVADSWEREGEDPGFFYQFSPKRLRSRR